MAYAAVNSFTYDLHTVTARFGQSGRTPRWKVAYLQRLIADHDFPAPLPLMVADRMTQDVRARSRWDSRAVDAWFDDRAPSGPAAEDPAARREADRLMDSRADAIGLRVINGGRQ